MDWMEKLEKAVKARQDEDEMPERDDEEQDDERDAEDDEDEGEDGGEEARDERPMKKSAAVAPKRKGRYAPKCNSEDEEDGEEPKVHDPKSIEKKTKAMGGGAAAFGGKGSGGFRKGLTEESENAIDASPVLAELVKGLEASHASLATLEDLGELRAEMGQINKGLAAIGSALTKSLKQQNELLKGIRQEVEEQGRQPAGRRSQLRKIEKGFTGQEGGVQAVVPARAELLKKSLAAVKAGTLDARGAAKLEASYNRGMFDHELWASISG